MVVINVRKRRRKAEQELILRKEEKEQQWLEEKRRKDEEERKRLEEEEQKKAVEKARREEVKEKKRLANELEKAEEEHKRVEEEKLRRAQKEEQLLKAEKEAKERAEKEKLKLLEAEGQRREEKRRKAEEKRKRVKEETQKKTKEASGRKQIPPVKRGGRPIGLKKQKKEKSPQGKKIRPLKPEVVCWREGWNWFIGIEVPREITSITVAQNGELLEYDNVEDERYCLKSIEGQVKVVWAGGKKNIGLMNKERNYLVFKMKKNWKELGRLVRCPTTGYYLIIVPQEWKRNEEETDAVPVEPESVQLGKYKAHFFYQEQSIKTVISFVTAKGERVRVESGNPLFQFVGREISDESEEMGPLFSENPPSIEILDEQGWSNVGVIVVGEEGSGRNRWRTQFIPQVDARKQKLTEEVVSRHGGWYFVRIYDSSDNLLESMDFRFMTSLNDIRIKSSGFLPSPEGYDNATVQFLHQSNCKVKIKDEDILHTLKIHRESSQTIVTVPPEQFCDKTHWILRDDNAEIEVTVLVKRIWWALGENRVTPTDWIDKPINLSHKDFTAVTNKALWVRLPCLRFVRKIDIELDRTKSRPYQVEVGKNVIAIPLREFCDAKEIENRQKEFDIKIWVKSEEAKAFKTVIVNVPADQTIPAQKIWTGYGRKKTAIAKAVLRQAPGEIIVNNAPVWMYFKRNSKKAEYFLHRLLDLDKINPLIKKIEIDIEVTGSQPKYNRQIKAVTHAIANALMRYEPKLKKFIKEKGFGGVRVTTLSIPKKQFTRSRYRNL